MRRSQIYRNGCGETVGRQGLAIHVSDGFSRIAVVGRNQMNPGVGEKQPRIPGVNPLRVVAVDRKFVLGEGDAVDKVRVQSAGNPIICRIDRIEDVVARKAARLEPGFDRDLRVTTQRGHRHAAVDVVESCRVTELRSQTGAAERHGGVVSGIASLAEKSGIDCNRPVCLVKPVIDQRFVGQDTLRVGINGAHPKGLVGSIDKPKTVPSNDAVVIDHVFIQTAQSAAECHRAAATGNADNAVYLAVVGVSTPLKPRQGVVRAERHRSVE